MKRPQDGWKVVAVLAAFAVSGVVSGVWSQRWAPAMDAEAARLATRLPDLVGEWDGRTLAVPPSELQAARADAICRTTYVHRTTGRSATALLLCGRPGPVATHTPDVCLPGAGFMQVGSRRLHDVPDTTDAQFARLWFQKDAAVPMPISVYFGWNDGRRWSAPENPRVAFAGQPVLFKLYVACAREPGADPDAADPAAELLQQLLPHLKLAE
jgi:hypothetical protein